VSWPKYPGRITWQRSPVCSRPNLARSRQKAYCHTTSVGRCSPAVGLTPSAEHKGYAVTTDPFLVGPAVEVSVRPPKVTSQRSKVVLGGSRRSLEPVGPGARRTKRLQKTVVRPKNRSGSRPTYLIRASTPQLYAGVCWSFRWIIQQTRKKYWSIKPGLFRGYVNPAGLGRGVRPIGRCMVPA